MLILHHRQIRERVEERRRFPPGWQWMVPNADGGSRPYVRAAATSAGVVAAHGFVIRGKQLVSPGMPAPAAPVPAGQLRMLIKLAFSACVWAAAMAAGMLVYQHFLRRWEEKGLPVLPVAALTTVGAVGQRIGGAIPLASAPGYHRQQQEQDRQREPPRQMSLIDEFEG